MMTTEGVRLYVTLVASYWTALARPQVTFFRFSKKRASRVCIFCVVFFAGFERSEAVEAADRRRAEVWGVVSVLIPKFPSH